jgi:hypothetical protein
MMNNKAIILMIISALLTAGLAQSAVATPHVENISLKKQGEFVELTVYADGPFTFSHFIEEAKAGKPDRIVLDMKQCLHKLPQFNFRDLPTSVITAIRTSQYTINPDKVVRIVADVSRSVTYTIKQGKDRITLVLAAPEEKEFQFWCAAPLSDAEKIKLALTETETQTVSQPSAVSANPDAEKKAREAGTFNPPPNANKETEVVKAPPTGLTSGEKQAIKERLAELTDESKDMEKGASAGKADMPQPAKPKAPGTPDNKSVEKKPAANAARDEEEPGKALTDSQAITPASPVKETGEQKNETAAPRRPGDPVKQDAEDKPKDWESEKELRDNPQRPPKAKGSLAATFPKREVVRYRSYGRRDPFLPLVAKALSGYQNGEMPDIETLRLVGIINGYYVDMALLEDMEGYGYILETGDKVKNGYVIEIYQNKILFQISEFGWSRSVALTMDSEEK